MPSEIAVEHQSRTRRAEPQPVVGEVAPSGIESVGMLMSLMNAPPHFSTGATHPNTLIGLQRTAGNQVVQRMIAHWLARRVGARSSESASRRDRYVAEYDRLPDVVQAAIEGGKEAYVTTERTKLVARYGSIGKATAHFVELEFDQKIPAEMQVATPGGKKAYVRRVRAQLVKKFGTIDDAVTQFNGVGDRWTQLSPDKQTEIKGGQSAYVRALWIIWVGRPDVKTLDDAVQYHSAAAREYDTELPAIMKGGNIEGGKQGYISFVRGALIDRFGSIEKAKQHYADIKVHEFLGQNFPVHKDMAARLDAAKTLLKNRQWLDIATRSVRNIGGYYIRPNANDASRLSEHSFGMAIDINADTNPNIKKEEFDKIRPMVSGLTGQDLQESTSVTTLRARTAKTDDLLGAAREMRAASDKYRAIFAGVDKDNPAPLKVAVVGYVKSKGASVDADALFEQVKAAHVARHGVKSLTEWLSSAGATAPSSTAVFLVGAYSTFLSTLRTVRDKKTGKRETQKVKGSITGTAATVASTGFLDLAPELIAAMVSSEGAGLRWLGAGSTVKDYMHFELITGKSS